MKKTSQPTPELSKKELLELIEFGEMGHLCMTTDGVIRFLNAPAFNILNAGNNYTGPVDFIDKNVADIHGEFVVILNHAANDAQMKQIELHLGNSDTWIAINWHLVDRNDTKVLELVLYDITSMRKVSEAYAISQQKLDSIIETIPDVIYQLDKDARIVFISDAIREYGYDPDELKGESFFTIVHPEDHEKAQYRVNERRTGERKTEAFELRIVTKDNDVRNVEVRDSSVEDYVFISVSAEGFYTENQDSETRFIGTIGIARDISRRIMAEQVTREVEKKYQLTLQSLQEGYYEMEDDGTLLFMNNALMGILGIKEISEDQINFFDFIHTSSREKVEEVFRQVKEKGMPVPFNHVHLVSNGKQRVINGSITPVDYHSGKQSRYGGIILDVTDQVKTENDLLQARKLEAVGILSGGIAHDYNNALTAVIGNLSLAKMMLKDDQSDLMDLLTDAEQGSHKIKDLTNRLSTFAKGGRPVRSETDMNSYLSETIPAMLEQWKGDIDLDIKDALWHAEIDSIQFSYALEHIINNAIEAMRDKGEIRIVAGNSVVEESASHHEMTLQKGNYILITICDNGPGINEEDRYKIFDPYYTTKDMASGMGLAISYAIIKRHRGYIDVVSNPGNGACFHIYIPAVMR